MCHFPDKAHGYIGYETRHNQKCVWNAYLNKKLAIPLLMVGNGTGPSNRLLTFQFHPEKEWSCLSWTSYMIQLDTETLRI